MTVTKRMMVEYIVDKIVSYAGDMVMDVPDDVLSDNGAISINWVRENLPFELMEIADVDIQDEGAGGYENAMATPVADDEPLTKIPLSDSQRIAKLRKQVRKWKRRVRLATTPRSMTDAPKDGRRILAEGKWGGWADWKWLETEWTRGEPGRQQYIGMGGLKHWIPCPGDGET